MKTILIYWMLTVNGVATDSIKSVEFDTVQQCEGYAQVLMTDKNVQQYLCIERYSLKDKDE